MYVLLILVAILLLFVVFPILAIRDIVQMRRDKDRGGGFSGVGGVVSELDRVVRPSVEHTIKAQEAPRKRDDGIGGD